MIVIGLHGRKQSGKDTACQIIRDARPDLVIERRGFADKMKIFGMRALGFTGTDEELIVRADQIKFTGSITVNWDSSGHPRHHTITGRQWWQFIGTEGGRETFWDSFWIDLVLPDPAKVYGDEFRQDRVQRALEERYPDVSVLIVTDVRFPNEAERIRDIGGQVWKINAEQRLGPPSDAHGSEKPLPDELVDLTVFNNGTAESFEREITRLAGREI